MLQERGGLTSAHWEEIIRRIYDPKNPVGAKIVAYGQKVIAGEFPDTNNHHRMYLGQRHWERIVHISPTDKVKKSRIFPPWPKTVLIYSELAERARKYADFERSATYTLDDYIASIGSKGDRETWCEYDLPKGNWVRVTEIIRPPTPGGWLPATSPNWSYYDGGTDIIIDSTNEEEILNLWLLTKEETRDPLHTSPTILSEQLREIALRKPDDIRERLKAKTPSLARLHNNPHFGILEQQVVNTQNS